METNVALYSCIAEHLSLLCRILVKLIVQFHCILKCLMWSPSACIHVLALRYHTVIMLHRHQISMPVQSQLKLVQLHRPSISTLSSMLGGQPAMVFFSACPAREEWDNLINHANGGVALTGSVLLGKVGPFIGAVDIAESEDAYVFRVSLPGVARDEKVFLCDVGPNGRILIKGVSVTGERKVRRKNMVFKMQTQNLCPPGEFTVSFQLRGPIDHLN
ncbi:Alpha-crystallin domain-containing protein 22.3 [Capsicum annuum]|uniref:Alpha-crystallin domain-containing protein 22.3 n=1 Tax=Capsicum annuum TaxID=4072 RepID=A0A2G2XXA7_CAPAN|nr:Alpha-crystallin domain-containing protein 22.3 [Capsicum annuum]